MWIEEYETVIWRKSNRPIKCSVSPFRLLTHEECTLLCYIICITSTLLSPSDIIRITLFMFSFIRTFLRWCRSKRPERWSEKESEKKRNEKEQNQDGAFVDLTKQFKRLSCPFNALRRSTEGRRLTITETRCVEWRAIIQTRFEKFPRTFVPAHTYISSFYDDRTKDKKDMWFFFSP